MYEFLSRIMPVKNVILDLSVTSKKRAFEQAGLFFENHHGLARSVVFDSLISRERLGSTALGEHVAIPHGRIKNLNYALAIFIRFKNSINFDSADKKPVKLVLALLIPEKATAYHLDILATFAQILSSKILRKALIIEKEQFIVHRMLTTGKLV
ncbi:MAG: PTS sugar transporter subunit IIA [Bordetella sp.]|nr:MAG: PTS sugar transporter subunit IIA [Bordetella sp.]